MSKKRGQNEGSIYQEAPGKWVASITAGYAFKDGQRRRLRKKFSAPTRREVAEKLTAALRSQHTGVNVAPNTRTVGWFLNYWTEQVVAPDPAMKPKTIEFYRYIVTTHLVPAIGDIALDKLTPVHVQGLLNDKRTSISERTKKLLSSRTVTGIQRTLRTALEVAQSYEYVQRNVAASKKKKSAAGSPEQKPDARFLQLDEARAMLAAATHEPLYYALFATILSLGMRLGEALGLGWEDVDLSAAKLRIRHTLQKVAGEMVRLEPKSSRSKRTIDLPAVTIAALKEHAERQRIAKEWASEDWKGNAWNLIFTSSTGTPLDERNVLRIFQDKILVRAKLPKMRIHDLRHSAVAILIAQGVSSRAISELLGHSSVSFTLQVYGHLFNETKRETADKMNDALAVPAQVAPSVAPSTTAEVIH